MLHSRLGVTLSALALAATLAACSENGTNPQSRASDPLVQQLNRLSNGSGQVLSVKKDDKTQHGAPGARAGGPRAMMQQPCYDTIDGYPCDPPPPYDPTCYSNCSWFDVGANVSTGSYGGVKWAQLTGTLYAYSNAAFGDAYIYFYSVGGCGSPSQFDWSYVSGSNGPFTVSASRYIEYTGGTFTWGVYTDGYAQNRYGIDGYESVYSSTCY